MVGNTAMHHLFLAIQPKYVALSPFTPAIKKSLDIEAKNLKMNVNPRGNIHILPIIAGFVGADAVADALSTVGTDAALDSLTFTNSSTLEGLAKNVTIVEPEGAVEKEDLLGVDTNNFQNAELVEKP